MKLIKYLLGPELFWMILYVLSVGLSRSNKKFNYTFDGIIENSWFFVPLLSVLIFGLFWIPFVEKNWLLVRIWITGIIMGHFVLETLLSSYSQQGPGIGMGYLAGIILLFILLVVGSIIVKLVF